jgi:GH25 family lysozyme M1 (1,4-beta-N-acetylmuramidase)
MLLEKLKGRPLEYGIWLDLESAALRKIGKAAISKLCYIYANMFRAAGYYVGIYCNNDWYKNVLDSQSLVKDFDFWIARYPKYDTGEYKANSQLSPKGYSVAWQYSSKGKVPGIKTNCDLNVDFDGVVNLMASGQSKKSVREIALEVLDNKWGTANSKPTRKELLESAGYNYEDVRRVVNQLHKAAKN